MPGSFWVFSSELREVTGIRFSSDFTVFQAKPEVAEKSIPSDSLEPGPPVRSLGRRLPANNWRANAQYGCWDTDSQHFAAISIPSAFETPQFTHESKRNIIIALYTTSTTTVLLQTRWTRQLVDN